MNRRQVSGMLYASLLALSGCVTSGAGAGAGPTSPPDEARVCEALITFAPSAASGDAPPKLHEALQNLANAFGDGDGCVDVLGASADGSVDLSAAENFLNRINAAHGTDFDVDQGPYVFLSRGDPTQPLSAAAQVIALRFSADSPDAAIRQIEQITRQISSARRSGEQVNRPCPSWVQALYVLGIEPHYIGQQCSTGG